MVASTSIDHLANVAGGTRTSNTGESGESNRTSQPPLS